MTDWRSRVNWCDAGAAIVATLALALLMMAATPSASAQTTGKIAGVVTDGASGETLPGVNIFIEGTTQGTATNLDGQFTIIGVRPGIHAVIASYIGFSQQRVENVQVSSGLTTELNFAMREEVFEGEEVVIIAERPVVQKDLTATTAIVSGAEIRAMPVENFGEVVGLQAGVVDGHFRGGRSGEVGYWVDGMPVTDVFDGSLGVSIENNMIEELQVVTGAFNAEYGQAMSGIVNVVTRDGSNEFSGGLKVFAGDYFSSRDDVFWNIDSVSPSAVSNFEADFSGPVIKNKLFFTANTRYFTNEGHLYGRDVFRTEDVGVDPTGRLSILNATGSGDSSFVPISPYDKLSGQAKLSWKLGNMRFAVTGIGSREEFLGGSGIQDLAYMPTGRRDEQKDARTMFFKVTHTLSNTTFYELGVTNTFTEFDSYLYADPLDERYADNDYFGFTDGLNTSNFRIGGTDNGRFNRSTRTQLAKLDITSQISQRNMMKAGLEFRRHDLEFLDSFTAVFESEGALNRIPVVNGQYNYKPTEFAAYIQDKIEFEGLIVNMGLRFDYFNSDGRVFDNETDPNSVFRASTVLGALAQQDRLISDGSITQDDVTAFEAERDGFFGKTDAKSQFSPRIGISFPISESGVVHFSYGWFFQVPNFELLYRNPFFSLGTGGSGLIGLIGNANLRPQKTINGEIGLKQAISSRSSIEITAYFRDINDLAGTATDPILIAGTAARYGKFVNSDFGFVRGIILRLNQDISDNLYVNLDYTFQVAKGNASDPAAVFNAAAAKQEREQQIVPLDWDQLHTANVSVNFSEPKYNFGGGLIASFGSGLPYTPQQTTQQTGVILPTTIQLNSEGKPRTVSVNLTMYKGLKLAGGDAQIFAKVDNLLDSGNEHGVFGDTGRATYSLQRNVDSASFQGNPAFLDRWYTRPDFYNQPRRVTLGLSYRF